MNLMEHSYNPLGYIWLSAAMAAIPIVLFIILLTGLKLKGYMAGLYSMLAAGFIAALVYKIPFLQLVMSALFGILTGIWPVAAILFSVILLYKITVKTGNFEIIENSISIISTDQRMQVLLIAYSFGAFLEGVAGFGAPVAITAALMVGLGFNPIKAASLCLIANLAGGAYGSLGIPVTVSSLLSGSDSLDVARNTALFIPGLSAIIPFVLVLIADGIKGIRQTYPAILASGLSFAITQALVLSLLGAELADIFAGIISMVVLALFLRIWKPQGIYMVRRPGRHARHSLGKMAYSWLPFAFLTLCVTLFNLPFFNKLFSTFSFGLEAPGLNGAVMEDASITFPGSSSLAFEVFSPTAAAIILTMLVASILFRCRFSLLAAAMNETAKELLSPLLTLCSILGLAFLCSYSGMAATIGLAFASTGSFFVLYSPFVGWLGGFMTGSVLHSGCLFGPLQSTTASQIGLAPETLVAVNIIGGTFAKIISPPSIAMAAAAVGLAGSEALLFKKTMHYSITLMVLSGIVSWIIF